MTTIMSSDGKFFNNDMTVTGDWYANAYGTSTPTVTVNILYE